MYKFYDQFLLREIFLDKYYKSNDFNCYTKFPFINKCNPRKFLKEAYYRYL